VVFIVVVVMSCLVIYPAMCILAGKRIFTILWQVVLSELVDSLLFWCASELTNRSGAMFHHQNLGQSNILTAACKRLHFYANYI
jgi:hypothetical protein